MDACADPKFFCQRGDHCCLKTDHEYYAQVHGQLAITGSAWCDVIVYQSRSQKFESGEAGEILDKCTDKMLAMYRQILRKNQS